MNSRITLSAVLSLGLLLSSLAVPAAAASHCTVGMGIGDWAYTYTGTIITPSGPIPVTTVGRFTASADGTLTGSQTRSVAGDVADETIAGVFNLKRDCTETYAISVFQAGILARTATLAVVLDNNGRAARGIFTSLTLPDGTNLPTVLTISATRLFPSKD